MNKEIRKKDILIIALAIAVFILIGLFQFVIQSELTLKLLATVLILICITYGIRSIVRTRKRSWRVILLIILYISLSVFYIYTITKGDYFLFYLLAAFISIISLLETLLISRERNNHER